MGTQIKNLRPRGGSKVFGKRGGLGWTSKYQGSMCDGSF